jgi:hypothetical protein
MDSAAAVGSALQITPPSQLSNEDEVKVQFSLQ